jgi:hypothetical protein
MITMNLFSISWSPLLASSVFWSLLETRPSSRLVPEEDVNVITLLGKPAVTLV